MTTDFTNSFILNSLKLPIITNIDSLANTLGLSKTIIFLLSQKTSYYYKPFKILKKDGNSRQIFSPSYSLKLVQRWILNEILEKIDVSHESMAYKKGNDNGIKKNAEMHKYNLYLLEFDLKDFFTSIKRERVFFMFKNLGYNNMVSNILTNICTYNDYLPQGGVCSPYISNLVCYRLDKRLSALCGKRGIVYTRYADDLTFSCDNKQSLKKVKDIIKDIIESEQFKINDSKTRLLSPTSHKRVTGITVNDNKLKANKNMKKLVRAMIIKSLFSMDYINNNIIKGYIAFINSIEDGYKCKIIEYINKTINKSLPYSNEMVIAYNENKFFKETNDMCYHGYDNIDDKYEDYEG
ncbi:retron St85 family RNA-directed DNA polymerase [Clostridium tagluense]|uniref:RNA-directed DNA polymerase n=1 Tax=Clostridium tagluense TaxID=360422 RepID=A0A401UP46_9CLOT|nr:retron St85 family RNA-directed DNA polymerase [Clostridium tagluense]GCD11315.1 RNA-directed DNA polymerase [Clostridium tagluense]